ncbi:hypothetical protein TNCV_984081 [Trichonephila clavipes]|nr:hypothetical protein TNCV_984081 [Trichonephila clavipes]
MFSNWHHNLCEYGSLRDSIQSKGGSRVIQTSSIVQNVLNTVRRSPITIVQSVGGSRSSVHRVVQRENKLLPTYHFQRVPSQIVKQISKHPGVQCISAGNIHETIFLLLVHFFLPIRKSPSTVIVKRSILCE